MAFNYNGRGKQFRKKAQVIMIDVIKQASIMILLEKRLEIYTLNGKKLRVFLRKFFKFF